MLFYDNPKWLPLSILALLAAIGAFALSRPSTSNLQLRSSGIGATYITYLLRRLESQVLDVQSQGIDLTAL